MALHIHCYIDSCMHSLTLTSLPSPTPFTHTCFYVLQAKCEQSVPQFFLDKLKKSQDFVEQLLDPRRIESYAVPAWISAELRSYQKDGVNWLAFLSRFNLHGILCDGERGCTKL